jgi:ubiquinone/menaquinone biosynthesis C-methylase UbiE
MAIKLEEKQDGKVLEIALTGKLAKRDYEKFVPVVERLVKRRGKIRIQVAMHDFHGWTGGALWEDTKFAVHHFGDIERLAVVGEKQWHRGMAMFCRPFTRAAIRYFEHAAVDEARAWIERERKLPSRCARNPSLGAATHAAPLRVFQSKDQTRAFYNKISRVYDLLSDRSEAPMRRAGLELLKARAGERILEIGFGTGHNLVALARAVGPTGRVFGLDLSDQMLKLAKANLAKAGLLERARLRCGDAAQLPYSDGSMDGVFMSFTLELFDTPEIPKMLRECKRVLRPGGRIVVVGMSKDAKHEPLIEVFEWTHKHFPNFLDCRPIYVQEALEKAGFSIQKALKKHMWIRVEIVLGVKE